jgi:hypothetical protein
MSHREPYLINLNVTRRPRKRTMDSPGDSVGGLYILRIY